ncbi:MAG: SH3 domain-containing protein [Proteobacteria bacterium]|nr:SH3 domain-containing protein [Pseudomonadota bacterium]
MDQLTKTQQQAETAQTTKKAPAAADNAASQNQQQTATTGTVTASALNVRLGPGMNYGILGCVYQGKQVSVIGKSGEWLNIMYGTQSAWVYKSYVKLNADVPESKSGADNASNNALVAIVQARGFKTNQDLINYFIYEHGNGDYNKGAAAAAKYGVDMNKLCGNRKGSALDTANAAAGQTTQTPAPQAEAPKTEAPKTEEPKTEEPKTENKPDPNSLEAIVIARGFQTNQDLINYFIYELGDNSYSKGAAAAAKYGVDMNALCSNRKGSALDTAKGKVASGPVSASPTTPKQSAVTGNAAVANFIRDNFPNGITAVFVYNGTNQVSEFVNQATQYASTYNPIGITNGTLGTQVFKQVKTYAELKSSVLALGESVKKCLADHPRDGFDDSKCSVIKNLTIMTHGFEDGLNLGGGRGNHFTVSDVGDFASAVKGYVADDIRVQLYACNTARNNKTAESWGDRGWNGGNISAEDPFKGGKGSFAQSLAEALGENASVYGHTTAGHLSGNYAARVYGKDAGGAENGKHMYDICFPADFIASEAKRLGKSEDKIRKETFSYYCNHFQGSNQARDSFIDPEGFAQRMRDKWTNANK